MLFNLAVNAKSEMVRLNALLGIAKCMGLQKDVVESFQGVKVIIEGDDDDDDAQPEQGRPALVNQGQVMPKKTIQIVK